MPDHAEELNSPVSSICRRLKSVISLDVEFERTDLARGKLNVASSINAIKLSDDIVERTEISFIAISQRVSPSQESENMAQ